VVFGGEAGWFFKKKGVFKRGGGSGVVGLGNNKVGCGVTNKGGGGGGVNK